MNMKSDRTAFEKSLRSNWQWLQN